MGFSESTQYPALIIFSFLLSTCNRNTFFQTINQYFIVYRFVYEWNRQVVIKQTQFLSTVLLCSEFKLEDIYSEVDFLGKNVCANFFFWWKLISADRWKNHKIAKVRARKNFLPHGKSWHNSCYGLTCSELFSQMMPLSNCYKVKKKPYGLFVLRSLLWSDNVITKLFT